MKKIAAAVVVIGAIAIGGAHIRAQKNLQLDVVQRAVSIAEIQRTLDAFNIDRTSGKDGERQAADYLIRKLTEYGVKHERHEARLFMSWPVSAEITVPGSPPLTIRGVTPAFGASTPADGLTADTIDRTGNQTFGPEMRGKIAILSGGVSPDRTLAAQRAGVAGCDSDRRRRDRPRNDRHDHLGLTDDGERVSDSQHSHHRHQEVGRRSPENGAHRIAEGPSHDEG